jgi:hypothetical protein
MSTVEQLSKAIKTLQLQVNNLINEIAYLKAEIARKSTS